MTAESVAPLAPPPDSKDWTWVLDRPCPECGFDAQAVATADIASATRTVAGALSEALRRPDAARRPALDVWSVLEYACHARDCCRVFDTRIHSMVTDDDPRFPYWDQDETALAQRYWEQEPAAVARELAAAAEDVAATFEGLAPEQWARTGRRSDDSPFTIASLGRYFLHDLVHHRRDVRAT